MNKNIKYFVNDRYLPFSTTDLIFRIIGYFVFSFIMIIPTEFILTDVQTNAFKYISFTAEYAKPLIVGAVIQSIIVSVITIILFMQKSKWSVIAIRGVSFSFVSIVLLILSCFCEFSGCFSDIIVVIFKLVLYILCVIFYFRYLINTKLPKFNPHYSMQKSFCDYIFIIISTFLVVMTKPLLNLFFNEMNFSISLYPLITLTEYICSLGIIINIVELFVKSYYAKKYAL